MSVYNYTDPIEFLNNKFKEKQNSNPSFSIRAWARQLGFKSHTPLYETLNGKRKIPRKYMPILSKTLNLSSAEGYFFETLVDIHQSKSMDEKSFYHNRLKSLFPKSKISFKELECYEYLRDPIHFFLLEMIELKDFQNDCQWIKRRLAIDYSTEAIHSAIRRLINLGLVSESRNNKLTKTHKYISSPPDVSNKAIQELHQNFCQIAQDRITETPVEEREYHSYAISASKKIAPKIKELIREFIEKVGHVIETDTRHPDDVHQLSINFFKVTEDR